MASNAEMFPFDDVIMDRNVFDDIQEVISTLIKDIIMRLHDSIL